jgi:hypothetical protein
MSPAEWIARNCKLAATAPVTDEPAFLGTPRGDLSSRPSLPHDIESWDQPRLRDYIRKIEDKYDKYTDFLIENRQALRESDQWEAVDNMELMLGRLLVLMEDASSVMKRKFG